MNQNQKVAAALSRGPLTPAQALRRYKIKNLRARISELRDAGFNIRTTSTQRGTAKYVMG